MNTRLVRAAEQVLHAAMQQGRVTAADLACALESAQLLQSPETAAELNRLRARVPELEAERHSTNEALSDAAEQLRADRDRIAELEAERSRPAPVITAAAGLERLRAALAAPVEDPAHAEDVGAQVQRLRALLRGQRTAVGDPHDSPPHPEGRLGDDLPGEER
ncbi:hypothetical protein [Streptomyces goshikiensis]